MKRFLSAFLCICLLLSVSAQAVSVVDKTAPTYAGTVLISVNVNTSTVVPEAANGGALHSMSASPSVDGTANSTALETDGDLVKVDKVLPILEPSTAKNSGRMASSKPLTTPEAAYAVNSTFTLKSSTDDGDDDYFEASDFTQVNMTCLYVGTHCTVWGTTSGHSEIDIDSATAAQIGTEFDNKFTAVQDAFGSYWYDTDSDSKVAIMCYDVEFQFAHGVTPNQYTGGYFWMADMIDSSGNVKDINYGSNYYINGIDCIHIDTYPGLGDYDNPRSDVSQCYSTLTHEFQHMINYSYTIQNGHSGMYASMESYLNEAFSMAAEHLINGSDSVASRISYFNNNTSPTNYGRPLTYWDDNSLDNYSLSYLFGQYIRTQYGLKMGNDGSTIFKQVLTSRNTSNDDDTLGIITGLLGVTKEELITNFWTALYKKDGTGPYGFGGEAAFNTVSPYIRTLSNGATIYNGGAMFYYIAGNASSEGSVTPTGGGTNIRYVSIGTAPDLTLVTGARTNATTGTISFISSEAGTFYYVASDTPVTAKSGITGSAAMSLNSSIPVTVTSAATTVYYYVKDAAGNETDIASVAIAAYTDTTAPVLSSVSAARPSETEGSISFTSDEAGTFYYLVSSSPVTIKSNITGTHTMTAGTNTASIAITGSAAVTVYYYAEDATNHSTDIASITIPAYVAPDVAPVLSSVSAARPSATQGSISFTSDEAGIFNYKISSSPVTEKLNFDGSYTMAVGPNTADIAITGNAAVTVYYYAEDATSHTTDIASITIPAYVAPDTTAPTLSSISGARTNATAGTVTFTSDEAGTFHFVVSDTTITLESDITGSAVMTASSNTVNVTLTSNPATTVYYYAEDAAHNKTAISSVSIPEFVPDTTAPALSSVSGSRTNAAAGTVTFTSNEAGTFHYIVSDTAVTEESSITGSAAMTASSNTVNVTLTSNPAATVYYYAEDAEHNKTAISSVSIPEFVPDTTAPSLSSISGSRTDEATGTVTFTSNEAGTFHYIVSDMPITEESGITGSTAMTASSNTVNVALASDSEATVYYYAEDAEHNKTAIGSVTIPEYVILYHTLTIEVQGGGEITLGYEGEYLPGEMIFIDAAPVNSYYMFSTWTSSNGGVFASATNTYTSFIMPANDTTITAVFVPRNDTSSPLPNYYITASSNEGGTISPSGTVAVSKGANTVFSFSAYEGYILFDVVVDGVSKGAISSYTFHDVSAAHSINAIFNPLSGYVPGGDRFQPLEPIVWPFLDVAQDNTVNWFYDAVQFVYDNELFNGTSETTFEPYENMSRGMFVTVLSRLAGIDALDYASSGFGDVQEGLWYSAPVEWAVSNNIIQGYGNGLFGPNDLVTCEQAAVIIYNYAKFAGYDVSDTDPTLLDTYDAEVSSWAVDAMAWAVNTGIIDGTNVTVTPSVEVNRAQAAQMMMNFYKAFIE